MGSELLQMVIEWKSWAGSVHWQGREPVLAKAGQKRELVGVGRIGFIWEFSPILLPSLPHFKQEEKLW